MTRKEFINSVAKRKTDIIQTLLDILAETGSRYCLIWDLAVNAYVEPVVSLDLDIVVTVQDVEATVEKAPLGFLMPPSRVSLPYTQVRDLRL